MPAPRIPDGRISNTKQLVDNAIDLTDEEVKSVGKIWGELNQRYAFKANSASNLDALRDEALTRFAALGLRASMDVSPCLYGDPPVIDFVGRVAFDPIHEHGFDHERQQHLVIEANKRNEDFRGQKEPVNKRRKK